MNNKNIVEKIYTDAGNFSILKLINGQKLRILDVGCGSGDNAKLLKLLGHRVDGITISDVEADIVKNIVENVYIFNLENGLPELSGNYDIILCSHVIEHIVYPEKLMLDIKRLCNHGAQLVVALPNLMNYKSRIEILKGNFEYKESGIWDFTHVKWYTFLSAKKLLTKYGFEIVYEGVEGDLPFSRFLFFLPKKVKRFLIKILIFISKGLFGSQLIFKAK